MYPIIEMPNSFTELNQQARGLVSKIRESLSLKPISLTLPPNEKIPDGAQCLYYIERGPLVMAKDGEGILFFEDGDFGNSSVQISEQNIIIRAGDFPADCLVYPYVDVLKEISNNPKLYELWSSYTQILIQMVALMTANLIPVDRQADPQTKVFKAGDVIVEQGSLTDEVFTMVEGRADVLVDGVKVGEIKDDEIFGAAGALTKTPRNAKVVSTTHSFVLSISSDQFISLIHSRPTTVLKLIQSMSQIISTQNQKLVRGQGT